MKFIIRGMLRHLFEGAQRSPWHLSDRLMVEINKNNICIAVDFRKNKPRKFVTMQNVEKT